MHFKHLHPVSYGIHFKQDVSSFNECLYVPSVMVNDNQWKLRASSWLHNNGSKRQG